MQYVTLGQKSVPLTLPDTNKLMIEITSKDTSAPLGALVIYTS
jgi:hypothetical protein